MVEGINVADFHLALIGAVALGNPLHQNICVCAQVNHNIRGRDLFCQRFMNVEVSFQLVPFKVGFCKKPVLIEGVVGNQPGISLKRFLDAFTLLMISAEQKKDLCLKSIPLAIAVKVAQKGVFFKYF